MSYIGNDQVLTRRVSDYFQGNDSQTGFTLSASVGTTVDLLVFVDGLLVNESDYAVSGNTLTFDVAPASPQDSNENNIAVRYLSVVEIL